MCGIMNVESPNYDITQSLTSIKYRFSRDNLTTLLGQLPLSADKTDL